SVTTTRATTARGGVARAGSAATTVRTCSFSDHGQRARAGRGGGAGRAGEPERLAAQPEAGARRDRVTRGVRATAVTTTEKATRSLTTLSADSRRYLVSSD